MKLEELRARRAKDRLARKEAEFRALPANSGARYNPLWGLCKCAIDAGYTTHDTLRHYIDGIYLSQWGAIEPYIDGTVKHALQDTDTGKADAVRVERSKAVSAVKRKYAEATPEFEAWVREKVMTAEPLPMRFDSIDGLDDETLSRDAMKAIVGDMAEGSYVYIGSGKADFNGVSGKSHSRIGFWKGVTDVPNDPEHNSWCPNVLDAPHRNKEHVQEVRYLTMEMDRPLCGDRIRETADALEKQELTYDAQRRYWAYILSRGCLSVRSLVYSGGKSVHALIPIACTKEEFAEKRDRIKACYLKLYMDDSMVDCAKKTRRPWGWRKMYYARNKEGVCVNAMDACALRDVPKEELEEFAREKGIDVSNPWYILQDVLWLDAGARPMTIDEFCEGMKTIYSEYIHDRTEEVEEADRRLQEPMPLVWVEQEDEAGEKTGRWVWSGRNIDEFLRNVGISQYDKTDKALGLLKRDYDTHIISDITSKKAWSIVYEYVKARSESMASELRDVYSRRFTDTSLGIYVGNRVDRVQKLMGRKGETYFPYRNGLLVVRPDSVELKPYTHETYYGEIWDDAPTLQRDWRGSDGKTSEMETFLRHMCGSELPDRELADRRYDAIRGVLGYQICACHEYLNWAVFLTDESLLNDDGGTGKSVAMKSIRYMRRMWIRDNATAKSKSEFDWSNVTRSIYNVGIDETDKDFDFREFFSKTTGGWNINHKYVDGTDEIPEMETPLLMFCTNNIPKGMEKSHERRKKIYEVSMHYHDTTPLEEFGHILYADWDESEWTRFDHFMVSCAQWYMANGMQEPNRSNVNMQTKQLMRNIPDEVADWLEESYVTRENEGMKLPSPDICRHFKIWCDENGRKNRDYATRTLNEYVAKYCLAKGISDDYKRYTVTDWRSGREVEKRVMCHCFWFKGGTGGTDGSSPKETGRTAHDVFLGIGGRPSAAGGEESRGFEEIGEAPF